MRREGVIVSDSLRQLHNSVVSDLNCVRTSFYFILCYFIYIYTMPSYGFILVGDQAGPTEEEYATMKSFQSKPPCAILCAGTSWLLVFENAGDMETNDSLRSAKSAFLKNLKSIPRMVGPEAKKQYKSVNTKGYKEADAKAALQNFKDTAAGELPEVLYATCLRDELISLGLSVPESPLPIGRMKASKRPAPVTTASSSSSSSSSRGTASKRRRALTEEDEDDDEETEDEDDGEDDETRAPVQRRPAGIPAASTRSSATSAAGAAAAPRPPAAAAGAAAAPPIQQDLVDSMGRPHGMGAFLLKGHLFEGEMVHGQKQGNGCEYYRGGDVLAANFVDNEPQGEVTHVVCGRVLPIHVYRGSMVDRVRTGYCTVTFLGEGDDHDPGTYMGGVHNNMFHGYGERHFADGTVYRGAWEGGCMHGAGTLLYPDGSSFTGAFLRGLRNGEGTLKLGGSGEVLSGTWLEGQLPQADGSGLRAVWASERLKLVRVPAWGGEAAAGGSAGGAAAATAAATSVGCSVGAGGAATATAAATAAATSVGACGSAASGSAAAASGAPSGADAAPYVATVAVDTAAAGATAMEEEEEEGADSEIGSGSGATSDNGGSASGSGEREVEVEADSEPGTKGSASSGTASSGATNGGGGDGWGVAGEAWSPAVGGAAGGASGGKLLGGERRDPAASPTASSSSSKPSDPYTEKPRSRIDKVVAEYEEKVKHAAARGQPIDTYRAWPLGHVRLSELGNPYTGSPYAATLLPSTKITSLWKLRNEHVHALPPHAYRKLQIVIGKELEHSYSILNLKPHHQAIALEVVNDAIEEKQQAMAAAAAAAAAKATEKEERQQADAVAATANPASEPSASSSSSSASSSSSSASSSSSTLSPTQPLD